MMQNQVKVGVMVDFISLIIVAIWKIVLSLADSRLNSAEIETAMIVMIRVLLIAEKQEKILAIVSVSLITIKLIVIAWKRVRIRSVASVFFTVET